MSPRAPPSAREALEVGHAAVEVDGQQEPRLAASRARSALPASSVSVSGSTSQSRGCAPARRTPAITGTQAFAGEDDRVARPRAGGAQRERDGLGAVGAGDHVGDAEEPREGLLEGAPPPRRG